MTSNKTVMGDLRTIVVSLAVVTALVAGLYATSSLIILKSYDRLEQQGIAEAVARARGALDNAGRGLQRTAVDYAVRDDAYNFANHSSDSFLRQSFTPDVLGNLDLDFVAVADDRVRQVRGVQMGHGYQVEPIDGAIVENLRHSSPSLAGKRHHAIMSVGTQHYLIAVSPISKTAGQPEAKAFLVAGQLIDSSFAEQLSRLSTLKLTVRANMPDVVAESASHVGARRAVLIDFIDDDTAKVSVQVRSLGLGVPMTMVAMLPRPIHQMGRQALSALQYALLLFGFVSTASVGNTFWLQHKEFRQRMQAEQSLRVSEERHRSFVTNMPDAVFGISPLGHITYGNPQAEALTGLSGEELLSTNVTELLTPEYRERIRDLIQQCAKSHENESFQATMLHSTGRLVPVEVNSSPVIGGDGSVAYLQWIARDVTERKRFEQELVSLANHDYLTGLDNRRTFEKELRRALRISARSGRPGALLWLDADSFKDVNDTLGHQTGDRILVGIAETLKQTLRSESILARMGGDEFAILLPDADATAALECGNRVLDALRSQMWQFEGREVNITASMGIVVFPEQGSTAEEVLARADLAMYYSKDHGNNRLTVYRPDGGWEDERILHLKRTGLINHALADATFVVHAQPIVDLGTGNVCHHELLLRIAGPDGDLLMPTDFLPAAELSGQIKEIDRWMVQEAIRIVVQELDPASDSKVHVNLSARAFNDPGLMPIIEQQMEQSRINPALLGFEITETAAVADMGKARDFIAGLKRLGCHVSLDDFGSGFSSFYYLKHLPVDSLKIDGTFIQNLATSEQDRRIVSSIVELAHAFGINAVAECIEDEETLLLVRELGVDRGQGYHLGRPSPVRDALRCTTQWGVQSA